MSRGEMAEKNTNAWGSSRALRGLVSSPSALNKSCTDGSARKAETSGEPGYVWRVSNVLLCNPKDQKETWKFCLFVLFHRRF